MSRPIIEVSNLSKVYRLGEIGASSLREELGSLWHRITKRPAADEAAREFWALRDVSFEVQPGEVVGIIGRNGAGKSTLLKILSRITEPTSGRAVLRGRVASLLEVGTGFHPDLSGRDNIFLNGAILGMKRAEIRAKFDEIVAFAEVEQFIDTPVKRYSSGMYVRLAFAVAAHLEPEILIIDEVLAVGDAAFQTKCIGKMKDVAGHGRTVLFVSHNMAMMRSFSQTIVWLNQGRLLEQGDPQQIITRYLGSVTCETKILMDLKHHPRGSGDGTRLKITQIEWLTSVPLFHSETVRVRIDFEAYANVDEATVGIGFSTLEGIRLLTYETDDPGDRIDVKKGRQYSTILEIESLPLAPGYYNVDIGSRSGQTQGVDYLPSCVQVEICPGKLTQGHQAKSGAGVRLPSRWTWHNLTVEA